MTISHINDFIELISLCVKDEEIYYYIHNQIDSEDEYEEGDCMSFFTNVTEHIRDLYYNKGESPWRDEIYDSFIEIISHISSEFKDKYGNGSPFVGHDDNSGSGEKTNLPLYMGSMNKLKSKKEITNWLSNYNVSEVESKIKYVCSAKLDGISALYANGKLYTRGNGVQGRNISYLLKYFNIVSNFKDILNDYYLRGELIIKKDTFNNRYKKEYNNSRNLVCGIMNRKFCDSLKDFYKDIDFVIYDINYTDETKGKMNFEEKFKLMKYLCNLCSNNINISNIHCVDHFTLENSLQIDTLDKVLIHWKKKCNYEIDGIIISHNLKYDIIPGENPKYSFAYKNNNLCVHMTDAIVGKVLWNVSKDYYIKPKIQLEKEVLCDNSKINFVTGFNAKYICENGICSGSKIQIGLSGNVIPHIFKVYSSGDPNFVRNKNYLEYKQFLPTPESLGSDYVWSKNKVDLIMVDKTNVHSEIKRNMIFFKSLDMKCGLQETTLVNLYNNKGIYKLEDVLCMSIQEWSNVSKIGEKKAKGFVDCFFNTLNKKNMLNIISSGGEIRENSKKIYVKFANGSQCFDRGLGVKKIVNILDYLNKLTLKYPDEFIFSEIYDNEYVEDWSGWIIHKMDVYKCKGLTHHQMNSFLKGLVDFNMFMYKLMACLMQKINLVIIQPKDLLSLFAYKKSEKDQILSAKLSTKPNFVMTGFRDKSLEEAFNKKGYELSNSVNKMTKYLIVKDINNIGNSSKVKKAQSMSNVCILDEKEVKLRL